jgi:Zn-dependent M28 family amino/carboxypeptidase
VAAFPAHPDYFQDVALSGPSPAPGRASNVVGFIRGSDPERAADFVALTAHYDHLGRKTENGVEVVFNGARDNALGVAALLSAARALALDPPARSILILAATAEEEGLIGSRLFVGNPPIPMARIAFVLNNDGAGVTRPGLWRIGGLEASPARPWVEAAGREWGLETEPYPEAFRSLFAKGDAFPFAEKGIPALTVSPGFAAEDAGRIEAYVHTPADRADADFDEEYLSRYCRAFAGLARRIADAGPGDPLLSRGRAGRPRPVSDPGSRSGSSAR